MGKFPRSDVKCEGVETVGARATNSIFHLSKTRAFLRKFTTLRSRTSLLSVDLTNSFHSTPRNVRKFLSELCHRINKRFTITRSSGNQDSGQVACDTP